ncbi:2-hydroxyacyl-CoA dehydratase subunit D [Chloroflexota bacterium]
MEEALRKLINGNSETERKKWALAWKERGGKVIGVIGSYVPAEIILAAGALPWRITGSWHPNTPLASVHRSNFAEPYGTHVLESLLEGELDFLDGAVIADWDVGIRRLWDVWDEQKEAPPAHLLYVPRNLIPPAYDMMAKELNKMADFIQALVGNTITTESLRSTVNLYNKIRTLIMSLYELRKREVPPLSGAEFLGLTTTAMVMPPEEFANQLEALLGYIEHRKNPVKNPRPRILVSSDFLDNPAYIELIEEAGSLVAMDDLDTGSRQFFQLVDLASEDLISSLATRYLDSCVAPRTVSWDEQMEQVIRWVRKFNIDGVIELPFFSHTRPLRAIMFRDSLNKAGIPNISIMREYHFANSGQLLTRIQAFLESIPNKSL